MAQYNEFRWRYHNATSHTVTVGVRIINPGGTVLAGRMHTVAPGLHVNDWLQFQLPNDDEVIPEFVIFEGPCQSVDEESRESRAVGKIIEALHEEDLIGAYGDA